MNYQEAVNYLASYTDYEILPRPHDPAFYDLRRVHELLGRIGDPHLKAKSVHITGSNGKGSTAAMIASGLTASGYTTGLYTSPHLHSWRERIKVDDELISQQELADLVTRLKPEIEEVNRKATYGRLTTFELLTTLAFAYYGQKKADFQVLEVGMGGRFDATSVIHPLVCVLTAISLEHTDVLGNTLTAITSEKAAIIKPGCTVIIPPQAVEVDKLIEETCRSLGAELIKIGCDVIQERLGFDLQGQRLRVTGINDSYEIFIPLLGRHQLDNAAIAVAALEALAGKGFHISKDSIIIGLAQVSWPGRLQVLREKPLTVVDGAHNPGAVQRLAQSLKEYFNYDRAILITGISNDKDIPGIVTELYPYFDKAIATRANHPRAAPPERIVAEFARHEVKAYATESIPEALSLAQSLAGDTDLICIAGSLFVVAEAIQHMRPPGSPDLPK